MRGAEAAPSGRCAKLRRTEARVRVAALAGGTGAAKLLRGLAAALDASALTVADRARPAPGVVEAIREADLVVVCPSNPVTSVGPIIAVRAIADALAAARAPVVGVSPIVGGAAVSGPAGALMRARGLPVSPVGIAHAYAPWLQTLLVARDDAACAPELAALGVRAVPTDVMMPDAERERALARAVLDAARARAPLQ